MIMARVLATMLLATAVAVPARATLVVIVPSASGMVVAADSRESIMGTECDGLFKIIQPHRRSRIAIVVTGDAIFVKPPSARAAAYPPSLCAYLASAPRLLDVGAVVDRYIEQSRTTIEDLNLNDLAAMCVVAVRRFQRAYPGALQSYAGRDIFSVVIASYNSESSTSTLLNFIVRMDGATREIQFDRIARTTITSHDRRGVWAFGETDYLTENVYRGVGRKYLSERTRSFILDDKPIAEVSLDRAIAVATNVIRAAGRTAETVPPPSGIGGPVNIVLLGGKPGPRENTQTQPPGPSAPSP